MRINKIVVTDVDGVEHEWEGIDGTLMVRAMSTLGQPYQRRVEASLLLASEPEVKA